MLAFARHIHLHHPIAINETDMNTEETSENRLAERLDALQQLARSLESTPQSRERGLTSATRHAEAFLRALPDRPVYTAPGAKSDTLHAMHLSSEPASIDAALDVVREHVDGVGQNLGSARFFAYIPSGSLFDSALADYVAAVSNRYAGVGYAAPGATRMEETLLRWLAELVGYPGTSEGDLTSGGSMAALSAVITAREALGVTSGAVADTVVYMTSQTHHTFAKALHIAGLGECVVRRIDVDDGQRMRPDVLRNVIEQDTADGLTPWFIGASAGTTDVGAVDPLNDLADIAAEFGLWFHVDAAYGGAFVLCDEGRRRLAGLERSDSLILDPHKGFFLPCGTGIVLVRDGRKLYDAFHARGVYMQDVAHDQERSPCDLSAELTRPFRALRMWLPLKVHGTGPFAAALEEKLLLARYFYDQMRAMPGMEVGAPPDLSIVPFRYVPETGDADEFNRRLIAAIVEDGRTFMTSTTLDGHYTIRLAVLNYMTHLDDVKLAVQVIREKVGDLTSTG